MLFVIKRWFRVFSNVVTKKSVFWGGKTMKLARFKVLFLFSTFFGGVHFNVIKPMLSTENIECWDHAIQGRRKTMEDKHVTNLKVDLGEGRKGAFFAVFDGFNGDQSAEYLKQHLLTNVHKELMGCNLEEKVEIKWALEDSFSSTNSNLKNEREIKWGPAVWVGSTAIVALIKGNKLFIANVGDSRAVLSENKKVFFATTDHKPSNKEEKERVEKEGGLIRHLGEEGWFSAWRLIVIEDRKRKSLGVTRAFGYGTLEEKVVIADPKITVHTLSSENDFLILACDGVWDTVDNQKAIEIVSTAINENKNPAEKLVTQAHQKGSQDNITAIVVDLRKYTKTLK